MSVTHEYPDLGDLSLDELKALKQRWIEEARADGSLKAVALVVRELGTSKPKKHGAIWTWERDGVSLWLDDWNGHYGARYGKANVCSVSYQVELFVPGPWVDVVLTAAREAWKRVASRKAAAAEAERARLLRQLGGAP